MLTLNMFTPFYIVSIVNFEQVNVSWDLFHAPGANGSFRNHVHESLKIMRDLPKTIGGKELVEKNCVHFNRLFALKERNQT